MSTTRITIDLADPESLPEGRVDYAVLDATTEEDIAAQQQEDDAEAEELLADLNEAGEE